MRHIGVILELILNLLKRVGGDEYTREGSNPSNVVQYKYEITAH